MLGQRDDTYRRKLNVPTVADRVLLRPPDELRPDPADAGREAADRGGAQAPGWWLPTILDVLARSEFTACGAPGETLLPAGLTAVRAHRDRVSCAADRWLPRLEHCCLPPRS